MKTSLRDVAAGLIAVLAIGAALRRDGTSFGIAGAVLFFLGIAVYLATNRAFAMLSLSDAYFAAATEAQKSALIAAGQVAVEEGKNRVGIAMIDCAGVVASIGMLRSRAFGKATAILGIAGGVLLIAFEALVGLVPGLFQTALKLAIAGGLCTMAWYLLAGRKLLLLGKASPSA
jgi:hypothetical protein